MLEFMLVLMTHKKQSEKIIKSLISFINHSDDDMIRAGKLLNEKKNEYTNGEQNSK